MSTPPRVIATRRPSLMSQLTRAVTWVCVVASIYLGVVMYLVYHQGKNDHTQRADAAVVLGAAVWVGNPSPVLKARLDHALQLYQSNTVSIIIVTGGLGRGDTISEAEAGAAYLVANGVPPAHILQETVGTSTFQSLQGAVALATINTIQTVLIVSDPFHMLRSLKMAGDLGLIAYASPTTTSPISQRPVEEWLYMFREAVAYTSYLFTNQ
jgi:uncharacterized SAM-binding protein YcdF (DUF218 family)